MSDETPDKSAAPATTAADDAPTAEMPRIPKNDHERAPAKRPTPADNNAAPGRPKPAVTAPSPFAQSRPGPTKPDVGTAAAKPAGATGAAASSNEVNDTRTGFNDRAAASVPTAPRTPKPDVRTAGDYARTNASAQSTTAQSTTATTQAVKKDVPKSTGAAAAATAASGRQASLKLVRVDPWSVTKVVFALTVALMIVAVVAVTILWIVLSFAGVWDQINSSVTTVLSDDSNSFDITEYLGFGRIVGLTLVISAINVVITTAVATIGAYLYNLAAQLLGGFDVTLAED